MQGICGKHPAPTGTSIPLISIPNSPNTFWPLLLEDLTMEPQHIMGPGQEHIGSGSGGRIGGRAGEEACGTALAFNTTRSKETVKVAKSLMLR